jgi:hypothetical protein
MPAQPSPHTTPLTVVPSQLTVQLEMLSGEAHAALQGLAPTLFHDVIAKLLFAGQSVAAIRSALTYSARSRHATFEQTLVWFAPPNEESAPTDRPHVFRRRFIITRIDPPPVQVSVKLKLGMLPGPTWRTAYPLLHLHVICQVATWQFLKRVAASLTRVLAPLLVLRRSISTEIA